MKIRQTGQKVADLLSKFKTLRDNDRQLQVNLWIRELGGEEMLDNMSVKQFFNIYKTPESILSFADDITRARRELNKQGFYRGEKYEARKAAEELALAEVRELRPIQAQQSLTLTSKK